MKFQSTLLALLASFVCAQDPASSWLAYVGYNASGKITGVNATWEVPAFPSIRGGGNAPGWWYGIEDINNLYLIQPILAYGDGSSDYTAFNGFYQWPTGSWYQSNDFVVKPGDVLFASLTYKSDNSYDMFIQNTNKTSSQVTTNIPVNPSSLLFQHLYFVTEHQPNSCGEYPASGSITFKSISVEVDGAIVAKPAWYAETFQDACNCQASVVSSSSLAFTWATSD